MPATGAMPVSSSSVGPIHLGNDELLPPCEGPAPRPCSTPEAPEGETGATRYRLAPGLDITEGGDGGTLYCLKPLMALRLNRTGLALLSRLMPDKSQTATELAADVSGLSPSEAATFLDTLVARRLLARRPAAPARWPSVQVIVAARGRPAATRACVDSLLALDYPPDRLGIVVVDDASEPPLGPVLAGLPVQLLRLETNVGQSAARNLAAAAAEADLLAFIDNDCTAGPAWLAELVPHLRDPAVAAVGGRVLAPAPSGPVAAYEAARSPLDMGAAPGEVGPREAVAYVPSCNLLVRRDALLAVGGFAADMRVGEDVDLVWRLIDAGGRATYAAAGPVTHDHRVRLGDLLGRRADYAASEAALQQRHPVHGRVLFLPRTVLACLAALALLPVAPLGGLAVLLLVALLVGAEAIGKHRRLARLGVSVPLRRLARPLLRAHGAALYHLGRDVGRYHGLPLLALALLWWPLLPAAALLLLLPPLVDWLRLRPAVSLPVFAGLHGLEMAAYQAGVWRGCLARGRWRPLLPGIRWRR